MAEHHQLPEVHELLVFHPEWVLLHEGPLQRLDDLDGFETSENIGGSRIRLGNERNGGRQRIQPIRSDGEGPAGPREGPLRPRAGIGEERGTVMGGSGSSSNGRRRRLSSMLRLLPTPHPQSLRIRGALLRIQRVSCG